MTSPTDAPLPPTKAPIPVERVRFGSSRLPTKPIAWAAVGFFVSFLGTAWIVSFVSKNDNGSGGLIGLIVGVTVALVIPFWPRPRFARELCLTHDSISGIDRHGKAFHVAGRNIELVSAEATYVWETWTMEPWGRLHIRAGRTWLAIHLNFAEAPGCYAALLRRFPQALGLSGNHEVDVPPLDDPTTFPMWAARIRRLCRRELRRQIAFYLLYASVLGIGGLACVTGYAARAVRAQNVFVMDAYHVIFLGVLMLLGSSAFGIAAFRRQALLSRILSDLARAIAKATPPIV